MRRRYDSLVLSKGAWERAIVLQCLARAGLPLTRRDLGAALLVDPTTIGNGHGGKAKGGFARAEILPPERRQEIARKAAEARWSKDMPRATYEGTIKLGDVEIACAVLDDGQRMITQSGFMRALGRSRQAKGRQYYKGDVNLPAFLTAQNLKPYISSDLEVTSSQVEIRFLNGQKAFAYSANLLPDVCDVFIRAERDNVLKDNQRHIADGDIALGKPSAIDGGAECPR